MGGGRSARSARLALLAALLAVCSCGSSSPARAPGGSSSTARAHDPLCNFAPPPAVYRSVIWIWFENTDEADVVSGTSATPYTGMLMDRCGLALNYHNITHPSLPNYIAATSGAVQGAAATTDCDPAACRQQQPSLFDRVQAAGNQWREYVQTPQGTCADAPAAYYPSLAARCAQWETPLGTPGAGSLHADLDSGNLAPFSFILPDHAHNMGEAADQFLSDWVPAITASPEYRAGRVAVFITWDEGGTNRMPGEPCGDTAHADPVAFPGCQVALIAVDPATGGAHSTAYFNHYSLLRTTEDMLGLSGNLGAAAQAQSMRAALHL